ncbi:hypothetical protein [Actinomadura citrea]|uniref:Orc1-like AAA ATPase domain-containing protein n=1 Tax=Actinomadura citrea TaxID=46158 RepID=A0A7Y9G6U8_9ACTN|nr:hypothetical protein [Actinomadura citrea]NYE10961.1 hypothetical protein [Actinomadura citrea]GGU07545.1 hypothetical protein GCM10010177_78480 [Actinomadura citrea]
MKPANNPQEFITQAFKQRASIDVVDISVRAYPEEINYIVFVDANDLPAGAAVGNQLDEEISTPEAKAFVIVRKASPQLIEEKVPPLTHGVQDERATNLTRLVTARARVSEAQPSLSYIKDRSVNLPAVTAPRHHLIFGRRGAGKSALLVEAKQSLDPQTSLSCWVNMQTLRQENPSRVFLYILEEVISNVVARQQQIRPDASVSVMASELYDEIRGLLAEINAPDERAIRLIPRVQRALKRFHEANNIRVFIFIDDFYYLPRGSQPQILDRLHGCVRDCDAWLKVASIRHLTRWFQSSPPLGLQTMHDADILDLDVTLQDPGEAKRFLESILTQYAKRVNIPALTKIFHGVALDRLVLASGAVPRDYLLLAKSAIVKAQRRSNAKLVGVQDVNQAAGDAAQVKVQELEEDTASDVAVAAVTLEALKRVRKFCLEETEHTYFLVSYREKENSPLLYNVLTDLLDLRLIHLIDGSVSDDHAAGHRSEAFMLDLSQFSGARLKQGIRVLDFVNGKIVSRRTRTKLPVKSGDTPLQVISILRAAPNLSLDQFQGLLPE